MAEEPDLDLDMGMDARITILADGNAGSAWYGEAGFSAHVAVDGRGFLFDTGLTGLCVTANAAELKIDLRGLDGIVLSHGHSDHSAGISSVLVASGPKPIHAHSDVLGRKYVTRQEGPPVYVGIPYVREYVEGNLGGTFAFHESLHRLGPDLYMTGEVPRSNSFETIPDRMKLRLDDGSLVPDPLRDDNSLILDTPKGLVFLFGCAHRGIVNIMDYGCSRLGKAAWGFIGGTHLKEASDEQFAETVGWLRGKNLGFIAPSHCTGIDASYELRKAFPEIYVPVYCGKVFAF
jgi:7,8-dihydropterin-6-yl-methyl-4-(beta-D-ribofuranosyl)aminobenzene 5'-phosphate synthase